MRRALTIVCCALPFAVPGVSLAAGGPVSAIQGRGVTAPGSRVSYLAIGAGRDTVVRRVRHGDRRPERSMRLSGRFGVAGAAGDGSTTGLSADGRTLVLAGMTTAYPPTPTTLVVLDARRLLTRARITLPGYYTVDAISPTGRWLYLIHYVSPNRDLNRYEVRAYDIPGRHLVRRPVIDPRDHGEAMLGLSITRVMSFDGRWAYTLYDRPGSTPFIHALDTQRRQAACVDLPISAQQVFSSRLSLANGGATLRVVEAGTPIAVVNTRTFGVRVPGQEPPRSAARGTSSTPHRGGGPWLPVGAALTAMLGAVAVMVTRRRRARSAAA